MACFIPPTLLNPVDLAGLTLLYPAATRLLQWPCELRLGDVWFWLGIDTGMTTSRSELNWGTELG